MDIAGLGIIHNLCIYDIIYCIYRHNILYIYIYHGIVMGKHQQVENIQGETINNMTDGLMVDISN